MMRNREGTMKCPLAMIVTLLLLSWLSVSDVSGYSRGAPDTTCDSLKPGHGLSTQSSTSPYTITPGAGSVEGGKKMLVTLQTPDGESGFMGFLVQARNPDTDEIVGTFFTTDHSYLTCGKGFNNAVTHSSSSAKNKVLLEWEAPSDYSGEVVFKGTFVKSYDTFWVGVTSEKVTVTSGNSSPVPVPVPVSPASTSVSTPEPSVSVSSNGVDQAIDQTLSPQNAGDLVINVVSAPGVDGVVVVGNDGDDLLANGDDDNVSSISSNAPNPTLVSFPSPSPTSQSQSPSDVTPPSATVTPGSPSDDVTGSSSSSSVSDVTSNEAAPSKPAAGGGGGGGKRRFGLLGRFKTTSTTPRVVTEAEKETTKAPRTPIEDLPPDVASLQSTMQNIYLGCNSNKGCYGYPESCQEKETCEMLATYSKVPSGYQFEILGKAESNSYVALGLSDDQRMGSDSVMACTLVDGKVDVLMGFNTQSKITDILSDTKKGLSEIKTASVDGRVYCSFIRQAVTEIGNIDFDLEDDRFHLMLARGPASTNKLSYHNTKVVSSGTSSMEEFQALSSIDKGTLFIKLHAALMIGAWVCAASCGILLARYYKQTWLNNKCCGIDQWFHFHRLFMFLTWAMTLSGFGLIVYHIGGWVDDSIQDNPHPVIGIVSIGLCFIQPFMALCRCSPTHKNRPVFNWFHWFVGNSAQILALTAIFFGFDRVQAPKWTWLIFVVFIAFHCVVHLILSIGQCVSDSKANNSNNVFPLKEMNGSRTPLHPSEQKKDAPGGLFRKTMLALYLIVVWVITALLILIVVAEEKRLREWGLLFWEK